MKACQISILVGALLAPLSAYAHPGHDGVLHELVHFFADVDPVWGGVVAGMAMIVAALWIGHSRT